jgi:membrane associated rhomboid family serine protease
MLLPLKDENPTASLPLLTILIIVINVLIFFYQQSLSGTEAQRFILKWGAVPYQIVHGEIIHVPLSIPTPLTIFSSMFLHGGFWHLGGNMLYLWIFGNNIEDALGHARFLIFYFLTGAVAALTQIFSDPSSALPMVGASGAVSGILGAYLLLYPGARILTLLFLFPFLRLIHLPAILVLGFWFFFQLLGLSLGQISNVAFAAHIGGFISGLLLVKILTPLKPRRRRYW